MRPGAAFCLSFDFELAWGSFDVAGAESARQKGVLTRERVFPVLVEQLRHHRIAATWATVGHLFLDRCDGDHGSPRPTSRRHPDWYDGDPRSTEAAAPAWYGDSLVRALLAMDPPQDVGLHGFSHCLWGEIDAGVAAVELANARAAADRHGVTPRSFVFPCESQGHHALLAAHGFTSYRDRNPSPYTRVPGRLRPAAHMAAQVLGARPATVTPAHRHGMVAIPASHLYLSMDGFRRHIPVRSRVRSARRGIAAAARQGRIFHLYTHPVNFAFDDDRTERLLDGFDRILGLVAAARDRGELEVLTMRDIAERFTAGGNRWPS